MVPAREHGFSLVELMMVGAIAAVLAGVSIPSIAAAMKRYTVIQAGQQVVGTIRAARTQAVGTNQILHVHIDVEARSHQILDAADAAIGPAMLLPTGAQFVGADADIEFDTSGRLDPALAPISIVVGDGDTANNRTITVTTSGRVTLVGN
jgi:prepilin-type N-terminal cleavage/methylation domain-containing protein